MSQSETIRRLLDAGGDDAAALIAPDRDPLSFAALRAQADATVAALNGCGIGRGDTVAIVLPNGPDMASAFVAIACAVTTAPLNPAYRAEELDFYLGDLDARALVVAAGADGPARHAAAERGIAVYELYPGEEAGRFTLQGPKQAREVRGGSAEVGDIGLILHTSGTTSRPKMVPLSQANLAASAQNIRETLALVPEDLCLNVMPLFHIHGLIAAVLSSLVAGAGIVCTPGFNALRFFAWLDEYKPTWYTAVPTMHQTILARAARNTEIVARSNLRLVRSSSASLPAQVMGELETLFGAPVIEAYGMTEAAHQMTSNPLPPAVRKPGSVGLPAGPEVRVLKPQGGFAEPGVTGEIVIRGPNVTAGYLANPEANAGAFMDGWFRTGDQGMLDADGYLTITGRLKEIINRGGEKVSPCEIDDVLMDHEAVAQVVTFAMPHDKLGEEVAAAVVLRDGADADERTLRDFAASRLTDFKVPRKIVFLDEIPKGATGKLRRIGLAEKLGL